MTDFAARRTAMVDCQVRPSDVTKYPIIAAMLDVPREAFVPADMREIAYADGQLTLENGRVMLEPRVLAKFLDALDIEANELALDIGSGGGYGAAVISRIAEAVVAVEDDAALISEIETALAAQGIDNVAAIEAPLAEGAAKHGPYDVVLIEGGIEVLPQTIVDQVKEGGRVGAILMDGRVGKGCIGIKRNGHVDWRFAFNASAPVLPGFQKRHEFTL